VGATATAAARSAPCGPFCAVVDRACAVLWRVRNVSSHDACATNVHMSVRHPMSPVVAKLPIQVFDCFSQNKGEQKDLIKIPTYFTYAKPTSTNFIYFFNFLM
jgi:hypothetical protein